jgi:thiamine monophosphate synthase
VRRRLTFFIGGMGLSRVGHLTVAGAAGVLAEALVLEAMDMSNVTERCEGEYELVVTNEGTVTG